MKKLLLLLGLVVLLLVAYLLWPKGQSREECLQTANSIYQKTLTYQTSQYGGTLPPEKAAQINQEYTDLQKPCY